METYIPIPSGPYSDEKWSSKATLRREDSKNKPGRGLAAYCTFLRSLTS